ncbi:MAG TPA: amidohydrolase family protein, partial [Burkholderiales bacterium]|nr:amidohydrolase family protein [Burkholderiales bacterium]
HARGVRGVRFAFNPQHGGELDLAIFDKTLACIEPLGWFVNLHFEGSAIPSLEQWLRSIRLKLVIDHIGRIDVEEGVDQAGFEILCDLARQPNVWIKLSGVDRLSRRGPPYDDVAPFVRRLCELAPRSLLWGSDWPHTGVFDSARMPDDTDLLDAFCGFVPDEALRRRILVENPLELLQ